MKISFLISCYDRDDPIALTEALDSINISDDYYQVEVIIVIDGPVNNKINDAVDNYLRSSNNTVIVERLSKNSGLGTALSKGSKICSGEYIFRIDSDDISIPSRVKSSIDFLEENQKIMAVGGYIEEFKDKPKDLNQTRKVPLNMEDIIKFSYLRNPMNHVTVCFRKAFFSYINYKDMPLTEDYYLWVRAIKKGLLLHNLSEVFVHVRVCDGIGDRRNGLHYFKNDIKFAKAIYEIDFFNILHFVKFLLIRIFIRFIPNKAISLFYKVFLRN